MLLPLAAIALIASVFWRSLGRLADQSQPKSPSEQPLPHQPPSAGAGGPMTPDRLVDERQLSQ